MSKEGNKIIRRANTFPQNVATVATFNKQNIATVDTFNTQKVATLAVGFPA